jgi:hypothetical protein
MILFDDTTRQQQFDAQASQFDDRMRAMMRDDDDSTMALQNRIDLTTAMIDFLAEAAEDCIPAMRAHVLADVNALVEVLAKASNAYASRIAAAMAVQDITGASVSIH